MPQVLSFGCVSGKQTVKPAMEMLFESHQGRAPLSFRFSGLVEDIAAHSREEVLPALRRIEVAVSKGMYAAGFLCYEAAAGLDPDLTTKHPGSLPLLRFGIFRERLVMHPPAAEEEENFRSMDWNSSLSAADFRNGVSAIREYIAAGHCYQVNYTMRLRFGFSGDPFSFYRSLCASQRTRYSAYLHMDRHDILSVSPELFFRLDKGVLTVRPMKGTAARGRWMTEDELIARRLRESTKEQAENLMIVDLLRNDLGRISRNGTVSVVSLFDVETFETVHQMTSTVTSLLTPGTRFTELLRALFPCGSVTGAPKKRSMEIIAELEDSPRGIYTGCIGYVTPGMEHAVFNVAIRTVVIDRESGTAELGVGSGITWDSAADAEFEECLAKGMFARSVPRSFSLLESMLFEEEKGFFLLERHLERLSESARYFGFDLNISSIRDALTRYAARLTGKRKVRVSLSRRGEFRIEAEEIPDAVASAPPMIAIAESRVDSSEPFLYHKTTCREVYDREKALRPDCLDVVFLNERDEITEAAHNNIVIRKGGELVTPPLESGLLPGTFRGHLLATGEIREGRLTIDDLMHAEDVYLINSVRKWRRVYLDTRGMPS